MNTSVLPHPEDKTLCDFHEGKLNPEKIDEVEMHLNNCSDCLTFIQSLPTDVITATLRATDSFTVNDSRSPWPNQESEILRGHPRYKIVREIGRGGMGIVYEAEHLEMRRRVAIKIMNRNRFVDGTQLWKKEIFAAGMPLHSNIVAAYDAEIFEDVPFYVMEYVEGKALDQIIAERGQLLVRDACEYIRQAAIGLQHLHKHGLVHRDIKPSNLMLTGSNNVKILDLGLAKVTGKKENLPELTVVGELMGTPDYMAPEQIRNAHNADIRADIYSLGCTFYCLLAGHAPYAEVHGIQKYFAHVDTSTHPKPLPELGIALPPELGKVIDKMMAKDPAQRYQTPAEVVKALEPLPHGILWWLLQSLATIGKWPKIMQLSLNRMLPRLILGIFLILGISFWMLNPGTGEKLPLPSEENGEQQDKKTVREKPPLLALQGPILFDARKAKELKDLAIPEGVQFSIFRDENLGKNENWIEYSLLPVKPPKGEAFNVLRVYYNVTKSETYNGIWFKLGETDWSKYARGEIVLRLCQLPPQNTVEISDDVTGKRLRDTPCTDNIKIELKAGKKANGEPGGFGIRYTFTPKDLAQQNQLGYFEVRIPINRFGFNEELRRVVELVLVFEEKEFQPNVRGNLGIQTILVVPDRGKPIDLDKLQKKNEKK